MARATIFGFAITVGILVPAGWHFLGADIETDGKRLRPLQQTLTLDDGTKVLLDVDRSVVTTGDDVVATLVAVGPAKDISVDVRALHSTNYSGERVERPWTVIDRETVKLTAAPKGGPKVSTRITLGKKPDRLGLEDSFKIMVSSHGVKAPKRDFDMGDNPDDARDFESLISDGNAAGIAIRGWSGNSLGMSIKALSPVSATEPFKIAVTIRNTSGHKLDHEAYVSLATEASLSGVNEYDDEGKVLETPSGTPMVDIERIDNNRDYDDGIARGASVTTEFFVIPHGKMPKRITLFATASENDGLGPFGAGAMDAKTFDVIAPKPEPKPAIEPETKPTLAKN